MDLQVSLGAMATGRLNQEVVGCVCVLVRDTFVLHVLFLRELNNCHSFLCVLDSPTRFKYNMFLA